MAAPASEDLREAARLLQIAGETGEPVSFATLQGELGVGHDDLSSILATLAEHGKAEEVAPGEWSAPDTATLPAPADDGRVRVRVSESDEPDEPGAGAEADEFAFGRVLSQPSVRLTMAIAAALDAAALGQIVKAGIEDAASRDEPFTMEVLP